MGGGAGALRVAVVHHTLSSLGGGERVFAFLVHALNKEGIVPDVYATDPESPERISEIFGVDVSYKIKKTWFPRMNMFGLYQRVLASYFSLGLDGYDVIFNTTGIFSPTRITRSRYVLYVYNPMISKDGKFIDGTAGVEKYAQGFWRFYFKPFKWLLKCAIRNLARSNVVVCAVSNFTREKIRKYWNLKAVTVYPPVDIDKFSLMWDNMHREGVILIGRYTPEKRHHELVEVARFMPDITFRLVGTANAPYYLRYYNYVKSLVERYDLKNVEVYVNVPLKKLVELLGSSKILVHALRYEDFGLTPAEGVCGGVIPLVHDSGGLREVVPFPDLRFRDKEEMARMIKTLSWVPYMQLRPRIERLRRYVIQNFSAQRFMETMLRVGGIRADCGVRD